MIGAAPQNQAEGMIFVLESAFHVPDWRMAQLLEVSADEMSAVRRHVRRTRGDLGEQELNAHFDSMGGSQLPASDRIYWRLGSNDQPYDGQQPHPALLTVFEGVADQQHFVGRLLAYADFASAMEGALDVDKPLRMTTEWMGLLDYIREKGDLRGYVDNSNEFFVQQLDTATTATTATNTAKRARSSSASSASCSSLSLRDFSERVCVLVTEMAFWGCFGRKHVRTCVADTHRLRVDSLRAIVKKLLELTSILDTQAAAAAAPLTSTAPLALAEILDSIPVGTPVSSINSLPAFDCKHVFQGRHGGRGRVKPEIVIFICTAIKNRVSQTVMRALFETTKLPTHRVINFPSRAYIQSVHDGLTYLTMAKKGASLIKLGRLGIAVTLQMDGGSMAGRHKYQAVCTGRATGTDEDGYTKWENGCLG
eukprot:COSAG01_NODE_10910_length_2053_cov_2.265097_2_plen_422_part_01